MDTVLKLSDYAAKIKSDIRIIGVPKTIDNDLCMIDHTPGFGSAAKYIASTMLEIAHDTFIYAVKKCHYRRNYGARCRMAHCCQCPGAK